MSRNTWENNPEHYLNSSSFLRTQNIRRSMRTLLLDIEGIEPGSKRAMKYSDKINFQAAVLRQLEKCSRQAFQTPVVVQIMLETSDRNPPHSHTIVKNLLDLLARPLGKLPTRRRALVYKDDAQVSVLSVTCHHGCPKPRIYIKVSPLRNLLVPLEMAYKTVELDEDGERYDEFFKIDYTRELFNEIRTDKVWWRCVHGNERYEELLQFTHQSLQDSLLGRSGLTVSDVVRMFNLCGWDLIPDDLYDAYDSSLLRIRLSEVPQSDGQSETWKNEVISKLRKFSKRWGHIINPLLVPVALEVVIKPPPPSRQKNVHDLDNFLRTYLLPRVLDELKPPSHIDFILRKGAEKTPPKSTRIGVTRYDAWRLPPAQEDTVGFVNLAIVTGWSGCGSVLHKIDTVIDRWDDSLV